MTNNLKMTVLSDNIASGSCKAEWGLCILIEADGQKILLDTGGSGLFAENARQKGIDLSDVSVGVLSHAHYDHADGLDEFFALNDKAEFLIREGCRENCWGVNEDRNYKYIGIKQGFLDQYADRIRYVSGIVEVSDGIWLVPHRKEADYAKIAVRNDLYIREGDSYLPDDFAHEQSLVIDTPDGLVIFNSCSHVGMTNILTDVREYLGRSDVCAYVGGLHLYLYTDEELGALCEEIKNAHVSRIYTGHCTGDHAFAFLKRELGDGINQFCAGYSCKLNI